jgi:hypothetical protein
MPRPFISSLIQVRHGAQITEPALPDQVWDAARYFGGALAAFAARTSVPASSSDFLTRVLRELFAY